MAFDVVQKYYLRKKDGEIDFSRSYDLIEKTNCPNLFYVLQGDTIGYMDESRKFVIPLVYDYTRKTVRGDTHFKFSADAWARIPNTNIMVTDVYKDNHVGLIDSLGNVLVPCQFEGVKLFQVSKDFVPIIAPTPDPVFPKLVMGLYDITHKRVCVTPKYNRVLREQNGYAPFQEGDTWGLLHCETGSVVVPPIYLVEFMVRYNGITIAFLGGDWEPGKNGPLVTPEDCHVIVTHGTSALRILSGYKWIVFSGPSIVTCWKEDCSYSYSDPHDTFQILKMPNYIALIKNAQYQKGNKYVEERNDGRLCFLQYFHAKYLSGGTFLAKDYEGRDIPVTPKMEFEILKEICK